MKRFINQENIKVSIIVPIFNCEKYLEKCLKSIMKQTYHEFELILIDDGSTDESNIICDGYEKKDERIKVIHKKNGGVSSARNVGLDNATGDCIVFIDSDDTIDEKYLEIMVNNIADVDMSVCGYYEMSLDGDIIRSSVDGNRRVNNLESKKFIEALFDSTYMYQGYLWNKMFIRSIIGDLRFDEKIYYNEDRLIVLEYLLKSKNISYNNYPLYFYLSNDESAMGQNKRGFSLKALTEYSSYEKMITLLKKKHYYGCYSKALLEGVCNVSCKKKFFNEFPMLKKYEIRWGLKIIFSLKCGLKSKIKTVYYFLKRK